MWFLCVLLARKKIGIGKQMMNAPQTTWGPGSLLLSLFSDSHAPPIGIPEPLGVLASETGGMSDLMDPVLGIVLQPRPPWALTLVKVPARRRPSWPLGKMDILVNPVLILRYIPSDTFSL